jgi:hypothetical protein
MGQSSWLMAGKKKKLDLWGNPPPPQLINMKHNKTPQFWTPPTWPSDLKTSNSEGHVSSTFKTLETKTNNSCYYLNAAEWYTY